jgi:hypothetical protein
MSESDRFYIPFTSPAGLATILFQMADEDIRKASEVVDGLRNAATQRHRYAAERLQQAARAIITLMDASTPPGHLEAALIRAPEQVRP